MLLFGARVAEFCCGSELTVEAALRTHRVYPR
jgi:hypothetical protein